MSEPDSTSPEPSDAAEDEISISSTDPLPPLEEETEEESLTLWDHLEDLRWTLVKSASAFMIAAVGIGLTIPFVAQFLIWPLRRAGGEKEISLITTSPMEVFYVLLLICFLGGIGLALPFVLFFIGQFVAPGLTPRELRMLKPSCVAAFFLFLLGASFTYFFILPLALSVSITFNAFMGWELLWTAREYYGLFVWMVMATGIMFQFPLVLVILIQLGILSTEKLERGRRITVVIIMIVSALITPSDPFSLFVLAIPLWLLFELSLVVGRRIEARRAADLEAEADTPGDPE